MGNFIYYEKLEDYEQQVEKAKLCDEKDKEIERLKKREQECIDHYLVSCKYASEMESKYISANYVINELEKDLDRQIEFCTNEADGTTNDKYCRIAINYLKHLKDKLQELKGSDK